MNKLVITDARLLDPERTAVRRADIIVEDGVIGKIADAGSGPGGAAAAAGEGAEVVDAAGRYVAPGLIDAHLHIESSMLLPDVFAAEAVSRGTTAVFVDPHEIANVRREGIAFFLEAASRAALDMYVGIPSCVPSTDLEDAGAAVTLADVGTLIDHPRAYGLAEMMNFPGIISGFGEARAKVDLVFGKGKIVDGHAPGVRGADLAAYISNGRGDGVVRIMSDHECTSYEEAAEKAAAGMFVALRYGSATKDMDRILPELVKRGGPFERFMLCSDDLEAEELLAAGHIDRTVRRARRIIMEGSGRDLEQATLLALRLAALNPGRYFQRFFDMSGAPGMGRLAEGCRANLVILDDLESFKVNEVVVGGRKIAAGGECLVPSTHPALEGFLNTVNPGRMFAAGDFRIVCAKAEADVHVIGVTPSSLLTKNVTVRLRTEGGELRADPERGLAKIAVIERHHATGRYAVGLVRGLGIKRGAVAGTVGHDSHNIIVAGADDAAMAEAVNLLAKRGGGMVAVGGGSETFHPLEVCGLMSARPADETAASYRKARQAARGLGTPLANVFMTLSFLALPVIPELKLTDRGLVDVNAFKLIPLF